MTPHDTHPDPTGPATPDPGSSGPRVTKDEVRDLGRLRRSRGDRKVAGVAGGVARHLDIDPLLVRIGFVVLSFFGGGGLILYGVAWLVVPEEDTEDTVVRVDEGVRTAILIGAGVLAALSVLGDSVGGFGYPWPLVVVGLVVLMVLGAKQAISPTRGTHPWLGGETGPPAETAPADAPPSYPGYQPGPPPPAPTTVRQRGPLLFWFTMALAALGLGVVGTLESAGVAVAPAAYPATVLGVVGLMLVIGSFYGRGGGLIFVGLVAAAATALTSITGSLNLDVGEIRPHPDTAADLAAAYDLDIGDIRIDLTGLDPGELGELGDNLDVELNVGHIRVIVPDEGLRVVAEASIELGEVVVFGDKSGNTQQGTHGDPDDPLLTIDADMVVGQIEILTEKQANR